MRIFLSCKDLQIKAVSLTVICLCIHRDESQGTALFCHRKYCLYLFPQLVISSLYLIDDDCGLYNFYILHGLASFFFGWPCHVAHGILGP